MLIEFSVANYRSFREKQTLSMMASKDASLPGNECETPGSSKLTLLKSAAVYGANASGKSNLVKALEFMRYFVLNSARETQKGDTIPVTPYRLDATHASEPSEFEVVIIGTDGCRYVYGFAVDSTCVRDEWLTRYRTSQAAVLFRRRYVEGQDYPDVKFGAQWKGEQKALAKRTRANALFLSVAVQWGHLCGETVFDWFRDKLEVISGDLGRHIVQTVKKSNESGDFKGKVLSMLKTADLGISDFSAEEIPVEENDVPLRIRSRLEVDEPQQTNVQWMKLKVTTQHPMVMSEDGFVEFDMKDESLGTQKFFSIAGFWISALEHGKVLVVDELSCNLHSLLTRALVSMINGYGNTKCAQLVLTTHDSTLIDKELFRRDQIWFAEKNPESATELYALLDYKPRKDENMRDRYLAGRYGAVPLIGHFEW